MTSIPRSRRPLPSLLGLVALLLLPGAALAQDKTKPPPSTGKDWTVRSGSLTRVANCGDGRVWGLSKQTPYQWNGKGWTPVSGSLTALDCGNDGSTWGTNTKGAAVRHSGKGWQFMGGSGLTDISVGNGKVVKAIANHSVPNTWLGSSFGKMGGSGLRQISTAADGTTWAADGTGRVYRFVKGKWLGVSGALTQISVGSAQQVWGVNAKGYVYRYNGSGWNLVPSPTLKWISVDANGHAWGVGTDGRVYSY